MWWGRGWGPSYRLSFFDANPLPLVLLIPLKATLIHEETVTELWSFLKRPRVSPSSIWWWPGLLLGNGVDLLGLRVDRSGDLLISPDRGVYLNSSSGASNIRNPFGTVTRSEYPSPESYVGSNCGWNRHRCDGCSHDTLTALTGRGLGPSRHTPLWTRRISFRFLLLKQKVEPIFESVSFCFVARLKNSELKVRKRGSSTKLWVEPGLLLDDVTTLPLSVSS